VQGSSGLQATQDMLWLFHVIAAILCVGILNSPVLAFTQEYPPAFGRAIYDWWKARKHQLRIEGYLLLVAIVIAF